MSSLNNSNAYGFCNNIVSNVIIKTLASLKIKASKCASTGKNFTTVEVSIPKIGKVACLAGNVKNNALALSMHHMMNCKNIGFIYNGKLYIINQLTLQSNWANLITKRVYMYTDGVGTRTSMTPADIDVLVNIANNIYEIPADILTYYLAKQTEYFKK